MRNSDRKIHQLKQFVATNMRVQSKYDAVTVVKLFFGWIKNNLTHRNNITHHKMTCMHFCKTSI